MPPALVKTASEELDIPYKEVKRLWEKAKNIALEEQIPQYRYVVGILKKMLGKKSVKKLGWKVTGNVEYVEVLINSI